MRCVCLVSLSVLGLVVASGCSQSEPGQPAMTKKAQPAGTFQPATGVVQQAPPLDPAVAKAIGSSAETFMRAILAGDTGSAMTLLTAKATERCQADPSALTPMGMDVEQLVVGEVRLLSEAEAAAQCLVTERGASASQELCCLLKLEESGWRVCGLACDTGDGSATVVSFEEDLQAASSPQFVEGADPAKAEVPRTANAPSTGEIR
ncbi:hypothetical protein [Botrimarina mediterranea]|uniref:DUF4878 domain-containing protein n=1 Tax=Botrimarina mediterranea TaxID=2528022 RepID=A0A518K4P1_9BACT|nr:hypothetical protein [Botrimarina mediterranea]QDV72763.1 hypothetical protein Spa11_09450 [Botrimarina mediterranea]QDV77337.1 hypothetical protein K2D_09280 [Planctomycetes bacterium K2D]